MITVTMEQIIDFRNAIDTFSEMDLPLKAAYKINKIRKALDKETDFYSEKFREIIDEYSKKDENGDIVFSEDGNEIIIKEESLEECNKALEDLYNLEVEVDNYNLKLEDLGEDFECTPDQLEVLMPFME